MSPSADQIEMMREMRKTMTMTAIGLRFGLSRGSVRHWLNHIPKIKPANTVAGASKKKRTAGQIRESFEVLHPQVLQALGDGEMTANQIATALGLENVKLVAGALCSMERRGILERCGMAGNKKNPRPIFRLPRADCAAEIPAPMPQPQPEPPRPVYRSPMGEFMGEPPIGRSALDARRANT